MKHYSTREAARILETTESQIRAYARLGQIDPERGPGRRLAFSFQELLLLRTTKGLLDSGVPARRMRRIWSSLRRQLEGKAPLTGISIFADGRRAVAWDGRARWRPDSGQFLLDFDAGALAERALAVPDSIAVIERPPARAEVDQPSTGDDDEELGDREPPALSAEQWFQIGCELEDGSPLEAQVAYRQAIEADPDLADAHLNLGRLAHAAGELGKAEAHYRDAVRIDADDPVAHFNLGVLLEDRERSAEAIHAYQRALSLDPGQADAHYNLGLLLESLGRRSAAMRHLMAAQRLYERTAPKE